MAELFQRRHFNWLANLFGELDLSESDLQYAIIQLQYTNNNFNATRFEKVVKEHKIN